MGALKPGATYIYERANGITYAREVGEDPSTRKEIGWDYDPRTADGRPLHDHIMDDKLWGEIRRAAKNNSILYEALERAKVLYYLSKDDGNKT
jgi:hypothetical protein